METSPIRVTAHPDANEQLLYFTSTSLLEDDRHLIFISDRTGCPNIFVRDLESGDERQLTHSAEGWLKSYVYFDGIPYKGLGKASISVHAASGTVYFIQGRQIRSVDIHGRERLLNEYPAGQMTAFTHVSADGTRLCVPTTDARALDDEKPLPANKPDYDIDDRVQAEGLSSYLRVYDTATGDEVQTVPVPRAWITHVQFSPANPDLILYNHEWATADWGIRRMWLWDGSRHLQLRQESGAGISPVRSRHDWTCHEMWERDGSAIIYHGSYYKETPSLGGCAYIGRVLPDGSGCIEIALPAGWKRYGHFTVGNPGTLVSDGYYEMPGDKPPGWGGAWVCLLKVDWETKRIEWVPLCQSGSSWDCQCSHPHPILNHAANAVYFTSDKDGRRAVYKVAL